MLWEAVAYALLGLLAAVSVSRLLPQRFPPGPLLLATGPVASLTGGLVTYTVFGGGHLEATFPAALLTSAALLSLLARPARPPRHAKTPAPDA
ncbi:MULTISPECIES: hypothetical protein [unclassified Streptomyces]|uniref:hypothetical protein n=1 Tax=unclassified Streptomyces TaxID=2593676 RepID=UPI002E2A9C07|nr:hypothetical protein [Streptomyces sp. NBC_00223]